MGTLRGVSAFSLGNLLIDARSVTREGVAPADLTDKLQERLERVKAVLHGPTVVTMGFIAVARGDLEHARHLFESVLWLDDVALGPESLVHAFHWLVTDAAALGDWQRVRWLLHEAGRADLVHSAGETAPHVQLTRLAPKTPVLELFAELAFRALGDTGAAPGVSDDARMHLPDEALRFAKTFSGLARAPGEKANAEDPLARVYLSLAWLRRDRGGLELEAAAQAVEAVLRSRRLREHLMERATLLGGGSPDEALGALRGILEEALGEAIGEAGPLRSPVLRAAAAQRRATLIEDLDARLDRLTDRCDDGTAPPIPEVWREFVALRRAYAQAVALSEPGERGWPHQVVLRLMRYLGTWLRLTKKERVFAHAVFQFLAVEAHRAGDEKSRRLALASAQLCKPFDLG